ncbi:hypothetical protein ACHAXR_008400 [Thalassiosira sp. AJA248-18]
MSTKWSCWNAREMPGAWYSIFARYYPDRELDINVENAGPLVYLGKRYKIRALLKQVENTTAMYFLLDSYWYQLDVILARSIDVTAAIFALFRRVILSRGLRCDSELLSLIVYSYCRDGERDWFWSRSSNKDPTLTFISCFVSSLKYRSRRWNRRGIFQGTDKATHHAGH